MKKLNAYYVISIVTLAFMFLILLRTLQAIGWFQEEGEVDLADHFLRMAGAYLEEGDSTETIWLIQTGNEAGITQLEIMNNDTLKWELRLSNFEDEQLLVEIFISDPEGAAIKLESCEMLLTRSESGQWEGSTLGDFCLYDPGKNSYIRMSFVGDETRSALIMETRTFDDQSLISEREIRLRRVGQDE